MTLRHENFREISVIIIFIIQMKNSRYINLRKTVRSVVVYIVLKSQFLPLMYRTETIALLQHITYVIFGIKIQNSEVRVYACASVYVFLCLLNSIF